MDVRMWMCITKGYTPPTVPGDTSSSSGARLVSYEQIDVDKKKDYEAESKALGSLRMALQGEVLHLFEKYDTSKGLWDALKEHCEGDDDLKKSRKDLLKKQYYVFTSFKDETLDETLVRYSHLLVEHAYFGYNLDSEDVIEKLLEALPIKWEGFITSI
uniref:uncharacterized protein LOC122583277 n=1 Tax=Erigeron canadensis TaxID=72917 RepID=UPI001CB8A284|nr:uncharacterized protein LOC122583277 [Erigeron canadensis]